MDERTDRSYLDYLSNQDKEELLSSFNECVFYHAMTLYYNLAPDLQLITDLRESGQHLFNVFNLTLIEINQRTINNPLPPYKDLLCVDTGILDYDACLECDPLVMISLPRLCFVSGLVYNKNLLPMTDLECELNWFRMDMDLLVDVSKRLEALDNQELHDLQYLLVNNKGQNRFIDIYKDICLVASNLTSRRASVLADVLRNAIEQLN
ncbi:hypothetical protein HDV06_002585 [Boothiomyces sp. JEL0866]|nr:hypothetical protein HDV06_002585 [Boothiomyces sp. JEL0866]